MKRKAVSVIMFAFLIACMLTLTSNIQPAECATIFSQNFDEEPTGSVPQGWTVENPDICSLTVNETIRYGDSGKSARFVDSASCKPNGSSYVGRTFEVPFTGQNSILIAEFSMMAEVPSYFNLYFDDGIMKYHGVNIYFTPYGRLAYYDDSGWHYLCPFSIDTWVRIKMVIDIPKNTYDIYVDGVLEAEGAHFRGFGTVTQLSRMLFGGNSFEMPIGYIDEISLSELKQIVTPVIKITGGLDYLFRENVKVRLAALVKDANTMGTVSDVNVTVQIYYPNGTLWISDTMIESLVGTGIYEWESNETIRQMRLEKGVYLVYVEASVDNGPAASDILLFHVDPPSETKSPPLFLESYYATFIIVLITAAIIGILLLRLYRKLQWQRAYPSARIFLLL